jgi:hypothetical protein
MTFDKQGSLHTQVLQSRALRAGDQIQLADRTHDVPGEPVHAVDSDGNAACGLTGLRVFDLAWRQGLGGSSRWCRDCDSALRTE